MANIITHTPIWVWLVLILLFYLGIKQTKTRLIKPYRLFIFPMVFLPLTLWDVIQKSTHLYLSLLTFLFALGLSFSLAKVYFHQQPMIIKNADGTYQQIGSFLPLILYVLIFICRYFVSVIYAMNMPLLGNKIFAMLMTAPTAIGCGILLAMVFTIKSSNHDNFTFEKTQ